MHAIRQTSISNTYCHWLFLAQENRKKIILTALGILAAVGTIIAALGAAGYLPALTIWIGGAIFAVSLPSVAVLALCRRGHSVLQRQTNGEAAAPNIPVSQSDGHHFKNDGHNFQLIKTPQQTKDYQSMQTLVEEDQTNEAWTHYFKTCYVERHGKTSPQEKEHSSYLANGEWVHLPPESLLTAIVDHWLSKGEDALNHVCAEFIRDCALQYTDFRMKCLTDDRLWECFKGYPEYIADISAAHPAFGLGVMISKRGASLIGDDYRIGIFRSSYQELISKIQENNLQEEEIKFFAHFLISYQLIIHKKDFEKVKLINEALLKQMNRYEKNSDEYATYDIYTSLLDLVVGKLAFQGIYEAEGHSVRFLPVDSDLINDIFTRKWSEELAHRIATTVVETDIRKGIFYLSLVPEASVHYVDAQMTLGNIWMDLDNFFEASQCFLQVAKLKHESSADALQLAVMSSLAMVKEGNDWVYALREDDTLLAAGGKEVRTLNPEECKSLPLDKLIATVQALRSVSNLT